MKMMKAKVLATGEEILVLENENEPAYIPCCLATKVYKADELEILNEADNAPAFGGMPPFPKYEPLGTTAMLKEMMDSVKGHFWRDQRVEIVKILLRREDLDYEEDAEVVEVADKIIQKLKAYGD